MKRHPDLLGRLPEQLGSQLKHATETVITEWFDNLQEFLQSEHDINVSTFLTPANGNRIFNLDESAFPLIESINNLKIITSKTTKNTYRAAPDSRWQITVLTSTDALGKFNNPYVIFPGSVPEYTLDKSREGQFDFDSSDNGWMNSDLFYKWLTSVFYPSVLNRGVKFPIILFVDGQVSHVDMDVTDFCREKDIILFCFPAHSNEILQPLDMSIFGPLKDSWNSALKDFSEKYREYPMNKNAFLKIFPIAWDKCKENAKDVIEGFRSAGLVPMSTEAVDFENPSFKSPEQFVPKPIDESKTHHELVGMNFMFRSFVKKFISPHEENIYEQLYDQNLDPPKEDFKWEFYKHGRKVIDEATEPSKKKMKTSNDFQNDSQISLNSSSSPRPECSYSDLQDIVDSLTSNSGL